MILFLRRILISLLQIRKSLVVIISMMFVVMIAALAYRIEPDTFETKFNALYWVMTTMATVGYGDYTPHTVAGKLLTIFIYIFGVGLLSLLISKIINGLGNIHQRRESGKLRYQGRDHIVIINWSKKAHSAIEELLTSDPDVEIVIIDHLEKNPYLHANVQFVSGDSTSEATLRYANIDQARSVILFADPSIDDPLLIDGKSLLVATTVESIAPQVHTTVEIMLEKHIRSFCHISVDEFVLSHEAISRLVVRSALKEGSIDIFTQLLSHQYGSDIYEVPLKKDWLMYRDAFYDLLAYGATLLSDHGDMTINRKLNEPIPKDAKLFVVCEADVYQRIIHEGNG